MLNNTRSRCPICNSGFFLGYHLFFNDRAGLECENCNSLLGHSFLCKAIKLVSMVTGVGFIGLALDQNNLFWLLPGAASIGALTYFQLYSKFIVLFSGSKYKNS